MPMDMTERQAEMRTHCIENLRNATTYPGYPGVRCQALGDDLTITSGPWDLNNDAISPSEAEDFRNQLLVVDSLGRPVHPWAKDMAKAFGLVAGKGAYWHWGPNYTADALAITTEFAPRILLVQRKDNFAWAVPGGFLDDNSDSAQETARRECREETDVYLCGEPNSEVYKGVVADPRTTAHAWAYNSAFLWLVPEASPIKIQEEEILDANWFDLDKLPDNLHGSHSKLIELALLDI